MRHRIFLLNFNSHCSSILLKGSSVRKHANKSEVMSRAFFHEAIELHMKAFHLDK